VSDVNKLQPREIPPIDLPRLKIHADKVSPPMINEAGVERRYLPSEDSILKRHILQSAKWAALYIWLCACGKFSANGLIKLKGRAVHDNIPTIGRIDGYNMMRELCGLKYFKRVPPEGRTCIYVCKSTDFVYSEFITLAEGVLGTALTEEIRTRVNTK